MTVHLLLLFQLALSGVCVFQFSVLNFTFLQPLHKDTAGNGL
jgi:hypothetical protein